MQKILQIKKIREELKMKRIGKMLAFLLAVVMILTTAFSMTALADETYTITIGNGVAGESYYAYKVLDVTLADTDDAEGYEAFSYSIKTGSPFFGTVTGYESGDYKDEYKNWGMTFTKSANFAADSTYVLTAPSADMTTVDAAGLAAAIGAYVLENDPDHDNADGTLASYSDENKTIAVSELGYYFIDTSLGSLCSLDTTAKDVTIYEKNSYPSVDKKVKDHEDSAYAKTADVHGGDVVDYQLTVNTGTNESWRDTDDAASSSISLQTGVDADYVIVDQLPDNVVMTVNSTSSTTNVAVTITDTDGNNWTADTDFTAMYDAEVNELKITLIGENENSALRKLGQNKNITIVYSAVVTDKAENDTELTNTATLTYKEQKSESTANVYSWSFDALKYTGTLGDTLEATKKLDGATFQLLNGTGGAVMKLISEDKSIYRYDSRIQDTSLTDGTATIDDPDNSSAEITVVDSFTTDTPGAFKIKGLDAGTYMLHETKAPEGYNILQEDVEVAISPQQGDQEGMLTPSVPHAHGFSDTETRYIAIQNNTGTELPSTGGMGTTLFYVIGAVLVIGAGVLLVVRRRMNDR